ncbi:MAG TPA: hypothetical protein VII33_13695 [Nakamurella sp.]
MPDSALLALDRSIDELKSAVAMLTHSHGKISVVARLCNDLERLQLDVADAQALRTPDLPVIKNAGPAVYQVSDEPYDQSIWGDDYDQEGVGGYHGGKTR